MKDWTGFVTIVRVAVACIPASWGCADAYVEPPETRHRCGLTVCPSVEGYEVGCNGAVHCEYSRVESTEPWHADEVWIYVPPGSFPMGSPESEGGQPDEWPMRTVTFADGFLIQKYPVTVRMHAACEADARCAEPVVNPRWAFYRDPGGREDHPQGWLGWLDAQAVCGWLDARLPTEAEWEYAAKGTAHRRFPWGDTPEPDCLNNTANFAYPAISAWQDPGCGTRGTLDVRWMAPGASAVGAFDMAGNVMEWVLDCWHASYEGGPTDGSAWDNDCTGEYYTLVLRGGAFVSTADEIRAAARLRVAPTHNDGIVGARCVRSLP